MTNEESIKHFLFKGEVIFTLRSTKSGKHWTFKIKRKNDNEKIYYVKLMLMYQDFAYLGKIVASGKYCITANSELDKNHMSQIVFQWFFDDLIERGKLNKKLEFYYAGECVRCGQTLTAIESIERGMGKCCAKKVQKKINENIS
ncbi:MAG: DUF6011 domain-containing protein [Pseudomonadales bacterium]|jgi:predicted  nucleic acid-binding Zn-ribbon protein|nr:DUF6011 domain-containing protein [Pseudomonadales bacterium]